ncbi:MAG: hypothetical protein PWP28_1634 [Oceanotoga sp.]|jgi:hypothetical protein|uniref:AAA family ATPase n=1 Tax=Oceanotoga sp. TaxID=2108366 RepID=UPI00264A60CF|nr:ATP-binding protein [Oceanotoga sp.]MDN5342759.1 hypothetical protein [Oceanotoga sp.]
MIIDFSFKNFRSFRDLTTLSMETNYFDENTTFNSEKFNLLKTSAIYGPNAGGKSNFFKAFKFFRSFILYSSTRFQIDDIIPVEKFKLDKNSIKEPVIFESKFIIENHYYRYGFSINNNAVEEEWLYHRPKGREARIFERTNGEFIRGTYFNEGKDVEEKTKSNTLFLSSLSQWNSKTAKKILDFIKNINILNTSTAIEPFITIDLIEKGIITKDNVLEFLKLSDFGINDFNIENKEIDFSKLPKGIQELIKNSSPDEFKIPDKYFSIKINPVHFSYDNNEKSSVVLDFEKEESDGTKKFFSLIGPFLATLKRGGVLLIDELDTSIHPLLLDKIIDLFNSEYNKNNAQLIFSTHNTRILRNSSLNKDNIWFINKNKFGVSELFSLSEIKNVRKTGNFENEYLSGKYGAIPYIEDILNRVDIDG